VISILRPPASTTRLQDIFIFIINCSCVLMIAASLSLADGFHPPSLCCCRGVRPVFSFSPTPHF
jgi:hypothetical protein